MNWQLVVTVVNGLAWPLTALAMAWILRREVVTVLGRVDSAKLPGGAELSFGKSAADAVLNERPAPGDRAAADSAHWTKVASIYWLGHDIMWTVDAILRGGEPRFINHGLTQSLHHAQQIGLSQTSPAKALRRLRDNAQHLLPSEWGTTLRTQYASDLRQIADQLGAVAESQQDGFLAKPAGE